MRLPAGGRQLATAALVQSLGIGMFMASSIAYFTRQVGLSANNVAAGLAAAGVVALGVSVAGGALADRYGARRVLAVVYTGRGLCFVGYAFTSNLWQYVLVTLCSVAFDRTGPPVLQALVAAALPEQRDRGRVLAAVNVLRNIGLGAGAMAAGAALTLDTRLAYRVTLGLMTLAYVGGAALVLRVPLVAPAPTPAARERSSAERTSALPDRHYLMLTGLTFLLSFFDALLLVAMPLWVLEHTNAPRATVSALFALNTALVVVFQIPVSKLASGLRRTSRMMSWAGAAMAVSSLCFAAGAESSGALALVALVLAVVALSAGEVVANSATWNLSIALAPEHGRGRHLSIFNLSLAAERVLGPVVVTGVLLGAGVAGWAGAALVFALTGIAAQRVALAGGARRPALAGEWTTT